MISNRNTITSDHWLNKNRTQRWAWALLVLFIITTIFFLKSNFFSEEDSAKPARDYIAFWSASHLALSGHPELAYNSKILHETSKTAVHNAPNFHWLYPPTYQAIILPIALLDYKLSFFIFISISFLALFTATIKSINNIPIIIALAFPAIYSVIYYGQNSFLTTALTILALINIERRAILSGITLGLLTIKPHMAIVLIIALIAGRHWRALITTLLSSITLAYLSYLVLGSAVWVKFFEIPKVAAHLLENHLLSWNSMTSIFVSAKILGASNLLAYTTHFIFSAIMLIIMITTWRKSNDIGLKSSIATLSTLTFSPYMFDYELIFLSIPLVFLTAHSIKHGWLRWEREIYTATWIFPLVNFILPDIGGTDISLTPIIIIMLTFCIIRRTNTGDFIIPTAIPAEINRIQKQNFL